MELDDARKELIGLQAELAKRRRTLWRIRGSFSFRLGNMLVRAALKPVRLVLQLTYRAFQRSPARLKVAILKTADKSSRLTSLRIFVERAVGQSIERGEPDLSEQADLYSSFLERFKEVAISSPKLPLVVISSGSKKIGDENRVHRSMMFAQELAAAQVPVLFVYYRFRGARDFVGYPGGCLLQIPNDLFHSWAASIAAWNSRQDKLILFSIPDEHCMSEVGMFGRHNWKVAYDVCDDWEAFQKAGAGRWYDVKCERFLCREADLVTTVSTTLKHKMVSLGSNPERTVVVPNGLARDFMEKATASLERRRSGYGGNGTIGYFGSLTQEWFNWKLLLKTAASRPDLSFELIGFGAPRGLNPPANVELLGEKTHDEIIDIASDWSVAIIPFKNTELAEAVDPIKVYEYLALGLPCVSCRMPQIEDYPLVFTYRNDSEFEEALGTASKYAFSDDDWACAQAFVAESTWDKRVQVVLRLAGIDTIGLE